MRKVSGYENELELETLCLETDMDFTNRICKVS